MEPLVLNLFDRNFRHQVGSVAGKTPRLVGWVRDQMVWDGITVFTDAHMFTPMVEQVRSPIKIGWLHEGKELHPELYQQVREIEHKFDAILTYDADLIAANPQKYRFTIRGGVWTPREQWGIGPKRWATGSERNEVCMILSEKTQLSGHKLRHAIADAGLPIDLYGARGTPIGHEKWRAYRAYPYAVVVEASKEDNLFTEHLLDAVAFGCVPIYWGCPNIGSWLDHGGIVPFNDIPELVDIIAHRTGNARDAYYRRHERPLVDNIRLLGNYEITEDWFASVHLPAFQKALEVSR